MIDRKEATVKLARSMFQQKHKQAIGHSGLCAYWALCTLDAARIMGYDAYYQAGTAKWKMIPKEEDDGVSPTHFGYEFIPQEAVSKFAMGILPELHCWVVVKREDGEAEFIDLSTKDQMEQARRLIGAVWSDNCPLPEYVWSDIDGLPEGCQYKADQVAMGMVFRMLGIRG